MYIATFKKIEHVFKFVTVPRKCTFFLFNNKTRNFRAVRERYCNGTAPPENDKVEKNLRYKLFFHSGCITLAYQFTVDFECAQKFNNCILCNLTYFNFIFYFTKQVNNIIIVNFRHEGICHFKH